jgi:hypothetical protein
MAIVRLEHVGNEKSFVVEWHQPDTVVPGKVRLIEQHPSTLGIAVSLVPGACMSEQKFVGCVGPPEPQGGYTILQFHMVCTKENATALLATGLSLDTAAAAEVRQYRIPDATVDGLRVEIERIYSEQVRRRGVEIERIYGEELGRRLEELGRLIGFDFDPFSGADRPEKPGE